MYIFLIFFISLCSKVGSISVNITSTQFLKDPDEITSSNNHFKVGFFSPPNSTDRYVGIWYNTGSDALEVVWVANKDNPLKGSSGVLQLSEDGNLQVLDDHNKVFWSSNITNVSTSNSSIAQLQDSGNLVLLSNQGEGPVWQSFEDPINLLIPLMTIGSYDGTNNTQQVFRSWKSPSDPSSGRFTLGITPSRTLFEIFIWNDGQPYWRTGPWNGNLFIGLPATYTWGLTDAFEIVDDNTDQPSLRFLPRKHAILVQFGLTNEGLLQEKELNEHSHNREITWSSIESECDVYGRCGSFGRCNPRDSPICSCLEGFEPINNEEWSKGNWTRGCARKTSLQCDIMTSNADGFLKLQNVKVPDHAESLPADGEEDCRRQCQAQCSCLAYAYNLGIGCITWNQTLIDIQAFNTTAVDLFIRLANSELADKNSKSRTIAVAVAITGTFTLAALAISLWKQMNKHRENRTKRKYILLRNSMPELMSEVEFKDLPLFKFENLEVATNNFHVSNKLGQGGFGPVFKGKLKDGQEVAVKRLSRASGQGLKQFMNEVLLISKLQHRNLVRLLGCCVEGEERLLVYEYMPNKSLDALLFDHLHREHLDWKTRFDIIKGICWGLLYLHRDSRLRIIHRDLKPSNILLDEDLNPKISDFGMAKIFGGVEDQGNTSRVVGTYGYMSPEYAMQGRVSEKLDVYSFGIMLLEIISGKRNGSFQDVDEALSISGHAWNLWKEDDVLSLIDPIIGDPCFQEEISKCIHIGLLCVQEFPEDRPTISTVISMLDSEILDLPCPMQPGFTRRRNSFPTMNTPNREPNCSINNVSITISGGR